MRSVRAARRLAAVLAALLPACASVQAVPEGSDVRVVWSRVDDVHKACEGLAGRRELFQILGCSKWSGSAENGGTRVCTIYAPRPRNEYDNKGFATLGHELMHCFDGNWHDRWGRMLEPGRQAAAGGSGQSARAENTQSE